MRLAELALCLTDPARVLAGIFILPLPRQTGPGWVGLQVRRGRKLREGAEPSQGQPADEIEIAIEEIVFREISGEIPANLLEGDSARFADIAINGVEQQQQRAAAARGLLIAGDFRAHDGLDGELFTQFPHEGLLGGLAGLDLTAGKLPLQCMAVTDRKSTRLNSSHLGISYAVFCL